MTRPFDSADFEARPWVADSGWPIDRQALAPYYQRAYPLFGVDGSRYEHSAWGHALGSGQRLAEQGIESRVIQVLPTRFGRVRQSLSAAPNLKVLLNSIVIEIVPNGDSKRITRVDVETLVGNRFSVSGAWRRRLRLQGPRTRQSLRCG